MLRSFGDDIESLCSALSKIKAMGSMTLPAFLKACSSILSLLLGSLKIISKAINLGLEEETILTSCAIFSLPHGHLPIFSMLFSSISKMTILSGVLMGPLILNLMSHSFSSNASIGRLFIRKKENINATIANPIREPNLIFLKFDCTPEIVGK